VQSTFRLTAVIAAVVVAAAVGAAQSIYTTPEDRKTQTVVFYLQPLLSYYLAAQIHSKS
jgi:hypothetical protein